MKKKIIILALFLTAGSLSLFSQMPPHPNGGNAPNPGNTPVGGPPSAPIDGGMSILLSLAGVYALKKIYRIKQREE